MKYKELRRYLKKKELNKPHVLKNCDLVIDGSGYFKDSYKSSGCQYVYGTECDTYAAYLKRKLQRFIDNDVTCYIIFSGCTKSTIEKRRETHQKMIDERRTLRYGKAPFFEPTLAKDVQREVLEEMGIKYFYCEYDAMEAMVSVARKFKCPVLTSRIDYCLYGVSCISIDSVIYADQIVCEIYDHAEAKSTFGVYNKMPLLLTLLNESGAHYNKLAEITDSDHKRIIAATIRWVKKQREGIGMVLRHLDTEAEKKAFQETYHRIELLVSFSPGTLAVKYFQRRACYGIFKDDKKWFGKAVSNGRVAVSYVDLKRSGVLIGSKVMFDEHRPDAMLAAINIISYCHQILTNSPESKLTFIGRKEILAEVCEIVTESHTKISNRSIFTDRKVTRRIKPIPLDLFVEENIPGFKMEDLDDLPRECRRLLLAVIYYVSRVNKDFVFGAYCVLLSYVTLGPVAEVRNNSKEFLPLDLVGIRLPLKDCELFAKELRIFKGQPLKSLDNGFIHSLAEFEHCLQHLNNLCKLCNQNSENIDNGSLHYKNIYNATFIYNLFSSMRTKDKLMKFLDDKLKTSSVLVMYKNIVTSLEICLEKCK